MAGNRLSEEDQQSIQEELVRLSTLLDQTVGQLKNEFKRRDEQVATHAEELEDARRTNDDLVLQISRSGPKELIKPEVLAGVTQWATDHLGPVLEDEDRVQKALATARKEPQRGQVFSRALNGEPNFAQAARMKVAAWRVASSCIFRWMKWEVFENSLQPVSPTSFPVVEDMENSLKEFQNAQGIFNPEAFEVWKSQTYQAWSRTPQYQSDRERYTRDLAKRLAAGMSMFLDEGGDQNAFSDSVHDTIIEPGLALKEQMTISTHNFRLLFKTDQARLTKDIVWAEDTCIDISDNLSEVGPGQTKEFAPIRALSSSSPGLVIRSLLPDGVRTPSTILVKQERLVTWGEDYDYEFFIEEEEEGLSFFSCLRETTNTTPAS
ncbi:uncharacterized protein PG986_001206 [Apiospora aurea]|uniref:Uncharacterized protein n=1 Tax=Apiospora aurea TaxID=335848 RepID=A0ABR1QWC8_9PEZI